MILIDEAAAAGLAAKASKSGVSIDTLKKVYRRGVAAWNSGHRPGTTPQQWGMARVNSYITKGKGTYHGADKDLREASVPKDPESGLPKKYVAGLSPSTAKARAAHFNKANKLSDRNPAAYKLAPGDKMSKTKESIHTKKFRQMFGEAKDAREYGYEGDMAMSQLKAIMQHAEQLHDLLEPDTDLPEWVQSKITLAYDYIQTAADYMATELDEEADLHEMKTVTNRSRSYAHGVIVGGQLHAYKKWPGGLHQPWHGPLTDRKFNSRAEMRAAMEKHPAYNSSLNEEVESIDELSKGLVNRYMDKNYQDRKRLASGLWYPKGEAGATEKQKKDSAKLGKRLASDYLAHKKANPETWAKNNPPHLRAGDKPARVNATEEMSPQEAHYRKHGFYSYALKAPTPDEAIGHAMNTITAKYAKSKPAKRTAGSVKEEALSEENTQKIVAVKGNPTGNRYEMHTRMAGEPSEYSAIIKTHQNGKHIKNQWGGYPMLRTGKTDYVKKHFDKLSEEAAANCAGGGNVAGIGVGPDGEPGVGKRKKNPVITNMLKRRSALNVIGGGKQGQ